MNDGISSIDLLLHEVVTHLKTGTKADKTAAFDKLQRIASIASTLALTLKLSR